jgi:chromosome segregation ATPase
MALAPGKIADTVTRSRQILISQSNKIKELTSAIAGRDADLRALDAELADSRQRIDELTKQLALAGDDLKEANERIEALEAEIADLRIQLSQAPSEADEKAIAELENLLNSGRPVQQPMREAA